MTVAALVLSAGLLPVIPQPVEGRSGDESYELRIAADGSAEIRAGGADASGPRSPTRS